MPVEILMPSLSPTMKSGTLSKWIKKEGDKVKSGDIILEIETDKAIMEVETITDGIIGKILVPDNTQDVKVNTIVGFILEKNENAKDLENYKPKMGFFHLSEQENSTQNTQNNKIESKNDIQEKKFIPEVAKNDRIYASPLAKRIASEKNIDLKKISGSGPNNRIVKKDLENINSQKNVYQIGRNSIESYSVPLSNMRNVIAKRLQQSKQEIPHFYLSISCNCDNLLKLREIINAPHKDEAGHKVSVNDMMIKSIAMAIKCHPSDNASFNQNEIIYYNNIDISIAVSIQDGLITPILKNADQKNIIDISIETKELIRKAKENKLRIDEIQGGGITISNLGMFGIDSFQAIINPPQCSILSIGAKKKMPIFDQYNQIRIASICNIGFSVDHRVLDGSKAAEFLSTLREIIENPRF